MGNRGVRSIVERSDNRSLAARAIAAPGLSRAAQTTSNVQVQRLGPAAGVVAAVKALTLAEAITAVGTIVSTAATIGGAILVQPQNDQTGVGSDAFLSPTDGDYLMSDPDRDGLAQVFRVLYFAEMEELIQAETERGRDVDDAVQEELKQTAIGNVKYRLTQFVNDQLDTVSDEFVQNGDGGQRRETPWGAVAVTVDGGGVVVNPSNEGFAEIAARHHVTLPSEPMKFIKSVKLSLECEKDWNLTWNDDIFVRVMSLQPMRGPDNHVAVHAEVAFDWDGDTTRYEWSGSNAIQAKTIPDPAWRGASDPDD